jgi:hypothetical protein
VLHGPAGIIVAAVDRPRPGHLLPFLRGVEDVGAKLRPARRVGCLAM